MTILVVGIGNSLRGDDGAGLEAARRLAAVLEEALEGAPNGAPAVRLLLLHQLAPEVALDLGQPDVEAAVFADAAADRPPGELDVSRVFAAAGAAPSSHHVAPALLLAMAQALYGRCPPAWLVTVGGAEFPHGEGFSAPVAAALARAPALAQRLLGDLAPFLGSAPRA